MYMHCALGWTWCDQSLPHFAFFSYSKHLSQKWTEYMRNKKYTQFKMKFNIIEWALSVFNRLQNGFFISFGCNFIERLGSHPPKNGSKIVLPLRFAHSYVFPFLDELWSKRWIEPNDVALFICVHAELVLFSTWLTENYPIGIISFTVKWNIKWTGIRLCGGGRIVMVILM